MDFVTIRLGKRKRRFFFEKNIVKQKKDIFVLKVIEKHLFAEYRKSIIHVRGVS